MNNNISKIKLVLIFPTVALLWLIGWTMYYYREDKKI